MRILNLKYSNDNSDELTKEIENIVSPLIPWVMSKFAQAKTARQAKEAQWTTNLQGVRGIDSGPSMRNESEVADVYVRTTSTKTKAAYAQINEALLSGDKFPIGVSPTMVPAGIAEYAHIKEGGAEAPTAPEAPQDSMNLGYEGDGMDMSGAATQEEMSNVIGSAYSEGLEEEMFEEGNDATGVSAQISPAKQAARKMEKMIHDQLDASKARLALRRSLNEACILGTGAMKGPFSETKVVNSWNEGQYTATQEKFPATSHVSIWDLFIDPNAYNSNDIEWVIERHRMNYTQMNNLSTQPEFDLEALRRCVQAGGNYTRMQHEFTLQGADTSETEGDLYEVLEFWGYMDSVEARDVYQLPVPPEAGLSVQVNAWICGNEIIRLSINPFLPVRIPYFVFPYEEDPYSIYGVGVPELMEDLQKLMNGMTRLAVENAMLAGNVILDVDKSALGDQNLDVYPGKVFERQSGGQGAAINAINIPFVAHQNMQMFDQFRQMADESTGIASITHGQTGVSGTGRTASGLSMLLDGASLSIKSVIRNIDDHLLKPLATSYFQWNMQFKSKEHPEIKGDLEIKPLGSFNLISKERKAQSLQTFLQLSTNPQLAPLIKLPNIVKELAIQMDMDPDEILNAPEESVAYAKLMQMQNPAPTGPAGAAAEGAPAQAAPDPGAPGFTGNNEGAGNIEGV